jgi:hypothetical protein
MQLAEVQRVSRVCMAIMTSPGYRCLMHTLLAAGELVHVKTEGRASGSEMS